jgi:hypothetical protein
MKGPAGVLRGWEARIVTIAVIAAGLFMPAQSRGRDVALLLQQTPLDGGIVTPSPGVHFFAPNSEIVLTAIPNPGYKFIYWLGDVGDPTANRTITYLNKPKVIIAIFEPIEDSTSFIGRGSVGGGRVTSGGLIAAAADYGGWGQTSLASSGSRPSESQAPNLYQQVVEPLPPGPPEYPIWPEPVTPSQPPIPEPATGVLLLLGSLFVIARKRNRALTLLFILCLVPSANAGLFISVNGVVEPPFAEVKLQPDATAVIGIQGDGLTPPPIALYLLVEGPGSIDGHTMVYRGSLAAYADWPGQWIDAVGPITIDDLRILSGRPDLMDLSFITFANGAIPPAPLDGLLIDDIILRCDRVGDVTLSLVSDDFATLYDTQAIQQVPEPVTFVLLGMGTFLMRRKRSL